MKKLISLFLVFAMLAMGCALAEPAAQIEAPEGTPFATSIVSAIGFSAETWMESGLYRGLFSTCLVLDLTNVVEADLMTNTLATDSYVGQDSEGRLLLLGVNEQHVLIATCDLSASEGYYYFVELDTIDGDAVTYMEQYMKDNCGDKYYANTRDDLLAAAALLIQAMEDDE